MAVIKKLKEEELVGGASNTDVYPVTHTKAVYDGNNKSLDDRLKENDDDRALLHKQSERVTIKATTDNSLLQEITGNDIKVQIKGQGIIETYGDQENTYIDYTNIHAYNSNGDEIKGIGIDPNEVRVFDYITLPNEVGSYTYRVEYDQDDTKYADITFNTNLRKYFGFYSSQPSSVVTLGTNHFSNSVGCTITIPAINDGYKPIYFEVPSGMTISKVTQPDALNAPLAITLVGTINRTINSTTYPYKLYKSTDNIDTTSSKRLTIS